MSGIRVTKLQRHAPGGYWTARLSVNGSTRPVHCRYGVWATETRERGKVVAEQHVLPRFAAVLQEHVRRVERRETRSSIEPPEQAADINERKETAIMPTATAAPKGKTTSTSKRRTRDAGRKPASQPKSKKSMGFQDAAEVVLRKAEGPMHVKAILEAIMKAKLVQTKSATPLSTLAPAMIWGVRNGRFVQTDKATFDVAELNPKGSKKRPAPAAA